MPDWTEPVSAQLKEATTSVLFQPLAFAPGSRLPVITGDVLSMLMPPTVVGEAALPALSTQSPLLVTDWPAPSPLTVPPAKVSVAMPDWTEPLSAQLNETVTSLLFQPFGVRLRAAAVGYYRCGLVDIDAADRCRRGGVAGVVDTVAAAGDRLTGAFAAYSATDNCVRRDAGLDCARVRTAEGDGNVSVVPAVGVRLGVAAAGYYRCGLVDIDATHRCRRGRVAGVVDAVAAAGDR